MMPSNSFPDPIKTILSTDVPEIVGTVLGSTDAAAIGYNLNVLLYGLARAFGLPFTVDPYLGAGIESYPDFHGITGSVELMGPTVQIKIEIWDGSPVDQPPGTELGELIIGEQGPPLQYDLSLGESYVNPEHLYYLRVTVWTSLVPEFYNVHIVGPALLGDPVNTVRATITEGTPDYLSAVWKQSQACLVIVSCWDDADPSSILRSVEVNASWVNPESDLQFDFTFANGDNEVTLVSGHTYTVQVEYKYANQFFTDHTWSVNQL